MICLLIRRKKWAIAKLKVGNNINSWNRLRHFLAYLLPENQFFLCMQLITQ